MKPLTAVLMALLVICANYAGNAQKKLCIVGSSTSACYGPTVADSCYVGRLKAHFNKQVPKDTIISNEFAASGYTVYQGMPSWYVSPYATSALQPDPSHNITAALATHPDVILINYPTNGYDYLTISEVLFCLRTIRDAAKQAGVPCFVTTTQPRTSGAFNTPAIKAKMALLKDSILAQFGNFAIDFYTGLIKPADSSIRYDAGDKTHMNNTGHDSLFQRVLRKNIFGNPPVIPTAPACVSNIAPANGITITTQTSATLTWNAAINATSYDVYIWTGPVPSLIPITNTTNTSFNINNLVPATLYKWFVIPKNQAGAATNCGAVKTTSFTTAAVPVPGCVSNIAPANALTISTQTSATLTWNAAASATSYDIYIWTGPVPSLTPIANTTTTSSNINNLVPSTLYKWFVVPKNQSGAATNCGVANTTSFTTAAVPAILPGCVTNLAPANGSSISTQTTATLSWSIASNAASYDIYIWRGNTPSLTPIANTTATTYAITGLVVASLYNWYIVPKNANSTAITCGAINKSSFTTAATPLPACATNTAPANGATLATSTTATLTWSPTNTATSYDIYIWSGTIVPTLPSATTSGTTYNAAGLTSGNLYNWYTRPKNAAGVATGCGTSNKTTFTTAPPGGTGLLGTYYNGTGLTGAPLLTRLDPVIDFSFSYSTVLSPAPGIVPQDAYSVRWTGQVLPQYTEAYTFYTRSDDGIRLWVNGVKLVDNWINQAITENSGTIALTAGRKYDIMIEYYENTGESATKLLWSSSHTPKAIIPQLQLYPTAISAVALARLSNANLLPPAVSAAAIPNPVKAGQPARVQISSDTRCAVQLNLVNSAGAIVTTQKVNLHAGMNTTYINTSSIATGLYFISITGDTKSMSARLLVQ